MRHKIWESGRTPHKRNDKGKKKPQALRQAKARLRQFKKRHMGRPKDDLSFYDGFTRMKTNASPSRNQVSTCQIACY
jgi:hypothetical protein